MTRMTKLATYTAAALLAFTVTGGPVQANRADHLKVCTSAANKHACALGSDPWATCPAGYILLLDGRTCRAVRTHGHHPTWARG